MKFTIKKLIIATLLISSGSANAAWLSFSDRDLFEAYIAGDFIVDNLETVGHTSSSNKSTSSGDFSWTMSDYNCENGSGCGPAFGSGQNDNSALMESADDDYIWTYNDGSFNFNAGISSFGIEFGSTYGNSAITLNGLNSGIRASGSFFGIASDDNETITSVTYQKSINYGSFDDVTYSRENMAVSAASTPSDATSVPLGTSLGFLSLGLLAFSRRK